MTTCRYVQGEAYRVLPGRHEGDLDRDPIHVETCRGCQRCTEDHA